MMNYLSSHPITFILGSLSVFLVLVFSICLTFYMIVKNNLDAQITPIKEQNERLREEFLMRYRFPKFSKNVVELCDLPVERKVDELKLDYNKALRGNDPERAAAIEARLGKINELRNQLRDISDHHGKLEAQLHNETLSLTPQLGLNAIKLPTGPILLIRREGKYGALQAIDQSSEGRGSFIRYAWWYQSDDSGGFTNSNALSGFGETSESQGSQIEIGPLKLSWSRSDDGEGWIYYGPTIVPSPEYELALTDRIDITTVNVKSYVFMKHDLSTNDLTGESNEDTMGVLNEGEEEKPSYHPIKLIKGVWHKIKNLKKS